MDTSFRDGFQSVYGARVLTQDFMPAVEAAVEAGLCIWRPAAAPDFNLFSFTATNRLFI
jgi:pyruvate carboxylase subunit B